MQISCKSKFGDAATQLFLQTSTKDSLMKRKLKMHQNCANIPAVHSQGTYFFHSRQFWKAGRKNLIFKCTEVADAMKVWKLWCITFSNILIWIMFLSPRCQFHALALPFPPRFWRSVSRDPLFPPYPSPCSSACTIMIVFPSCCCCSYWVTHIQLQISVNPCFLRPPFVSTPPPLEIIMVAAQCLGVKLWSLGRAALIIYPFSCVHRAVGLRFAVCEIWTDFCSI